MFTKDDNIGRAIIKIFNRRIIMPVAGGKSYKSAAPKGYGKKKAAKKPTKKMTDKKKSKSKSKKKGSYKK